jgi:hypothetical protein
MAQLFVMPIDSTLSGWTEGKRQPRVARTSQPWALRRSSFQDEGRRGIESKGDKRPPLRPLFILQTRHSPYEGRNLRYALNCNTREVLDSKQPHDAVRQALRMPHAVLNSRLHENAANVRVDFPSEFRLVFDLDQTCRRQISHE